MFCNKCQNQVQEGSKFCPFCGNALMVEPLDNNSESVVVSNVVQGNNFDADKVNIWLVILSWFVPIVGLVVFFVKKSSSPKTAKASGICALISFCLNIVVLFFLVIVFLNFTTVVYNQSDDIIDDAINTTEVFEETIFEETDYLDDSSIIVDWEQYQVSVNSKKITLPVEYSTFATATGFSLKDTDLTRILEKNYYSTLNMYKNDKLALYAEIYNDSISSIKCGDGKITRINQTKYHINQNATPIVFPGGLKAGDSVTESKIRSLFGEPSKIDDYSAGEYSSKAYIYYSDDTWTTTNYYKITVLNGIIDSIVLDHRNYD